MSVLLLTVLLALAEDPTAVVEGTLVRGSARLDVPVETFLSQLVDPTWESRVGGIRTEIEVKGTEGDCQQVAFVSPNPIFDAAYEVLRCPTADGWQGTLISSNAFSTYRSGWTAVAEGEGARITYEVDLTTSLWVPNSIVRSETRRSVLKMLKGVVEWSKSQVETDAAGDR